MHFWRFRVCPSNDIFEKNKKIDVGTGLDSKHRKSAKGKANIGNPKVNRGCPPFTANRTSADYDENSLGPSLQYILLGVYHTGGFNAMVSRMKFYTHIVMYL